jgi:hypothetical protein
LLLIFISHPCWFWRILCEWKQRLLANKIFATVSDIFDKKHLLPVTKDPPEPARMVDEKHFRLKARNAYFIRLS